MSELALALVFLVVVGVAPAYALLRDVPLALAASGTAAGLVATVASTASLVTRTPLLPWLVLATVAGWAGSAWWLGRAGELPDRHRPRHHLRHRRHEAAAEGPGARPLAAALVAVLSAPMLLGALAAPSAWDARSIWWFHATWYWRGGDAAANALGNRALAWAHADYPPFAPSSVASAWSVLRGGDLWFAQAVSSVQTWMALCLAALLVVGRLRGRHQLLAALAGGAFALGCAGFGEGLAARGYVDVLWAATATAGAVAALALPPGRRAAALAATCFAAAALTKGDGMVTVVAVLVPLAALRWWWHARRSALPWVAWAGVGALAGLAWPVLVGRYTVVGNASINGDSVRTLLSGDPDARGRIRPTVAELWSFSRGTALATAAVVVVGVLLAWSLARARSRGGPATGRAALALSPGWLVVAAAGACGMMAFVFAAGVHDLGWWLMTAGQRTMTIVRCLLLAEVLVWTVVALDVLLAPGRRTERAPGAEPAPAAGPRPAEPAQSSV